MGQMANQMFAELIGGLVSRIKSGKNKTEISYKYDPDNEKPIIRASICNGEQVAGFKNKHTGEFHEVMLIRSEADKALFMETYGLNSVDTVY